MPESYKSMRTNKISAHISEISMSLASVNDSVTALLIFISMIL